jgi:hypothetical protein
MALKPQIRGVLVFGNYRFPVGVAPSKKRLRWCISLICRQSIQPGSLARIFRHTNAV